MRIDRMGAYGHVGRDDLDLPWEHRQGGVTRLSLKLKKYTGFAPQYQINTAKKEKPVPSNARPTAQPQKALLMALPAFEEALGIA